ncbi:malonyl CoA-acyl carrier protein transacylase [Vibrio cholerae]|nr:malonyl CoA-acyl carrier protein transacylase [Vibrio cholerae]
MSKFAIVFPGQGSQAVGMLADLAEQYAVVKQTFAEASEVLGYDLWALVQDGPVEDLNQTFRTQPALLAASVAIWRVRSGRETCAASASFRTITLRVDEACCR